MQDDGETDIDCGGSVCGAAGLTCADGQSCDIDSDCTSWTCQTSACQPASCGDGVIQVLAGEQCDHGDSNGATGDGCSADCQILSGRYASAVFSFQTSLNGYTGGVGELNSPLVQGNFVAPVTSPGGTLKVWLDDGFGGCPVGVAENASLVLSFEGGELADAGGTGTCPAITAVQVPSGFYSVTVGASARIQYYVLEVQVTPPS
jgi:cysteine-rich repeat protein